MIEDAVTTEFLNQESLRRLLAQEEETKAKANMTRQKPHGPRIRWRSTREDDTLGSEIQLIDVPVTCIPAGLGADSSCPARASDVVFVGGSFRPRRRVLLKRPDESAAPGDMHAEDQSERRAVLFTGEDVSRLEGFGDLGRLPWGDSVLQPF